MQNVMRRMQGRQCYMDGVLRCDDIRMIKVCSDWTDHATLGQEGYPHMAQVFPRESLMNPVSPQLPPQEFLIFQQSSVAPTRSTPWLTLTLQLLKTPPLQGDQLEASTATETGLAERALRRSLQPETSTQDVTLQAPVSILQFWSRATQAYWSVVVSPLSFAQSKAESIHPPLQPWLPQDREQSTNCCSDRFTLVPFMRQALSMAAVAEKAQQDPHAPWFLTGVTLPSATQSISPLRGVCLVSTSLQDRLGTWRVRQMAANSAWVRSVNWLMPMVQVFLGLALCSLMAMTFLRKMFLRYCSSPSREQCLPNSLLNCSKEQTSEEVLSKLQRYTEAAPSSTSIAIRPLFITNDYQSIRFTTHLYGPQNFQMFSNHIVNSEWRRLLGGGRQRSVRYKQRQLTVWQIYKKLSDYRDRWLDYQQKCVPCHCFK